MFSNPDNLTVNLVWKMRCVDCRYIARSSYYFAGKRRQEPQIIFRTKYSK